MTDETGHYRFDDVPLGEFRVAAIEPDVEAETVSARGTLSERELVAAPDLVLPARSEFTIQVQGSGGEAYGAGVPVEITDAAGTRTLYTDDAGQVVTRTMLLEKVWDYHFDPQTNVIDVHVSRLRGKIDKDFSRPLLHTVRGAGYRLEA